MLMTELSSATSLFDELVSDINSRVQTLKDVVALIKSKKILPFEDWKKIEVTYPDKNQTVDIPDCEGVYIVYIIETGEAADYIKSCFEKGKKEKEERKYARFNKDENSGILYVGSSKTRNVRIKQHLALSPSRNRTTYALWLNDWFKGTITLSYIEFPCTKQEALQAFEDSLWNILRPMFGRQGKR